MKFVIRKVPERDTSILERILPDAVVYSDDKHEGCIKAFIKAIRTADDDAVYIQDDMILTENFREKASLVIRQHPNDTIVFCNFTHIDVYKTAKKEGYYPANKASWLLCTYIPKLIGQEFIKFMDAGAKGIPRAWFVREADDTIFERFLVKEIGEPVYLVVPNLAGHPANGSSVNPSREVRLTPNFDYSKADAEYKQDRIYQRTMEFVNKGIYHEKR